MKSAPSLDKSTSSVDKLTNPIKKLATLGSAIVEKMPMSERTKVLVEKRPKKFLFKLLPSVSVATPNVESLPILALTIPHK